MRDFAATPISMPKEPIQHQHQFGHASKNQNRAQNLGCECHSPGWRINQVLFKFTRFHQTLIIYRMLILILMQGHTASEHADILRELVRPEVAVEEVHREQEHRCQERFLAVHDRRRSGLRHVLAEPLRDRFDRRYLARLVELPQPEEAAQLAALEAPYGARAVVGF